MKYFKIYSESISGEVGHFYCEVSNGMITRQIDEFGKNLYWSDPGGQLDDNYLFTDKPEFDEVPTDAEEISAEKFNSLWAESHK